MDYPEVTICGYNWTTDLRHVNGHQGTDHTCNELLQGNTLEHVHFCCCGAKDYSDQNKPRKESR